VAQPAAAGSTDPNAIKTLVVTGLPKDLTKNVLWKRVRKVSDKIELVFPVEGSEDTGS
jgi:nucleolar protein 4